MPLRILQKKENFFINIKNCIYILFCLFKFRLLAENLRQSASPRYPTSYHNVHLLLAQDVFCSNSKSKLIFFIQFYSINFLWKHAIKFFAVQERLIILKKIVIEFFYDRIKAKLCLMHHFWWKL